MGPSGRTSPFTQPGHSRCDPAPPSEVCVYLPVLVEPWLLLAWWWEGFSLSPIGNKDWMQPPWRISCAGVNPMKQDFLQKGSECTTLASGLCFLWRWLGGASLWSEAVHQVHWLWDLWGGAGQGQLLSVFFLGPPGMSYKAICRWLLCVLGLEVPRRGQAEKQSWLLLVLGLGPLARGTGHANARCYLFEKFRKVQGMSQDRSFE